MYSYTKESLETLKNYGATPDLVQVGNEIMYGLCDVKVHPYENSGDDWDGYLSLLSNGCKAVREVCPEAKIVIHTDRPTNTAYNKFYYQKLVDAKIDFDVIGLSYYPFWHGWLTAHTDKYNYGLSNALDQLATDFPDKKVQIVETAYNFQYWPTSGVNYDTRDTWTCSADGQYGFVKDLIDALAKHDNVDGLFYWCPEEAGNGDNVNWDTKEGLVINSWLNRGLWWSTSSNGHWPITSGGNATYSLIKTFLNEKYTAIEKVQVETTATEGPSYNFAGQRVSDSYKGIVVRNGKKVLKK
jgi:arabinogalactan endo-1,4-beta-galactosidase